MPAVTDLTWGQLNEAFRSMLQTNENVVIVDAYGRPTNFNFSSVLPEMNNQQNPEGVVKFVARLLDACRIAQEAANTGKTTGERLTAFPAPTVGAPVAGAVPVTRAIAARAILNSATQVIGTIA